jgi:signal transduction histidine kinase/CheY-like chemotaxis protein
MPDKTQPPPVTPSLHLHDLGAPIGLLDEKLCLIRANPALRSLFTVETDGILGQSLIDLLTAEAVRMEARTEATTFVFRRDDQDRWMRLDLHNMGADTLAVLVDVTAEREMVEQVRAAYATRDGLMHDAEVGTWRYDPDAEIYHFSTELTQGFNALPVDLPTMALIQHPDDASRDAEIRERVTREGGAAEDEIRYRNAHGGWRTLRVHYRAGRQTASGRYEMHGLSQNVTSLAAARDLANTNALRLKLALGAAGAGVFEFDYRERAFWFSRELKAMIGSQAPSDMKNDPLGLFHPDDRQAASELRSRWGAGAVNGSAELRLLTPRGAIWVRLYFEVERGADGQLLRGVGLVLNIDAHKRQELALSEARRIAEAATAAKSSFLASVSHEIRTPMNGIVGVLNLLKRENLSAEGRGLLEEALGCSDMLAQLINDVLDFSKIEAGKLELSPTATDPVLVTEGVLNLVRPQTDAKGLYLRCRFAPDMGHISVDPVRLRQCLFNMVGNAVKFTERGGVEVRLSFVGAGASRQLRCEVEDTGIGVPDSARATLFDRFQQGDSGTNRRFGGTGLGLAISRNLAQMMGGDLDFESEEGRGSTFWFQIAAPHAEAPTLAEAHGFSASPLTGLRVLVVDDNRTNRIVGVKSLNALGAEAEAVDSGAAAIEAVGRRSFDLILMDINMPQMDGLEATRRIRALGGAPTLIPIVALTADAMSHQQNAYLAAGMNGMVPKPFSPAQLLTEIGRLIEGEAEPERALSAAG